MTPTNGRRPEADRLQAFSLGRLSDTDSAAIEAHLADCPSCCQVLAGLDDRDRFLCKLKAVGRRGAEYPDVPGYEMLGILGHGGMGVVYRARQLKANRLVALKMMRAVEHATPEDRLRFQIETEAVARLQHPHIAQLYEAGEVRGVPFFSLEFCDGGTLDDQLAKQRPSPRAAAELLETLARAMHYAHLRGVVHRDLKPGNVLLAGVERLPKITDFGLAKRIDAEARDVSKSGGGTAGKKTEIEQDFEIAVHDVTQGQWEAVMGTNPSAFSRKGDLRYSVRDVSDQELKLFPVETVSWDDAQEFIKKLNEQERGHGYLYRLPTEAEWEYACRGGATSEKECSYHFYFDRPTNDLSSEQANFNGNAPFGKAAKGKYLVRPTRVGAYPSNRSGLCDMHGNVEQWCADSDPSGPEGHGRMIRGGCWLSVGVMCCAARRSGDSLARRAYFQGFRLARVPVR
jgi:formylglycine-generating enzyme required for sulfatase activity